MARDLFNRMADLLAAECIADVVAGTPVVSEAGLAETVSISIGFDHSMILRCSHLNPPMSALGKVDWSMVSRVRVEKIEGDDA
ncbi:hypothetical protein ACFX5Q_25710 [Mesorhizobium sp. IMUNJ 23033]|uniref:hypothetical protein n=1 Tax=Mesorhizobium sp. IMUNJ 23033 TaxID=3378039 RepID=UPI00384E5D19